MVKRIVVELDPETAALWELEEQDTRAAYLSDPDTARKDWPEPPWEPWTIAKPGSRAKMRSP
jgi:hypothetical protein